MTVRFGSPFSSNVVVLNFVFHNMSALNLARILTLPYLWGRARGAGGGGRLGQGGGVGWGSGIGKEC